MAEAQQQYKPPTRPVEIVAAGMLTPIGADAAMTLTSVGSSISAYTQSSVMNKNFDPMIMALVPEDALPPLDDELAALGLPSRQQRMLRLATPAIQQLQDDIANPLPLMLCGPEKMPGRRSVISDDFLKYLHSQTKVAIDLENSYVFPEGRAGGFYALEVAMQMLEAGEFEEIILGGVDTFLDLYLLATFDSEDRVLAEGMMDAFVPGEAAAFLILKLADETSAIKVYPPGISDEPGHRYSTEPYRGEGLANAVREALSKYPGGPIETVFASFNGENFNAKEWGVAAIRNQQQLGDDFEMVHPADCYGDIGAATVPVMLALASLGILEGQYRQPALIWASSEIQQRAAACIGR